jgi:ubiquinone/menaquinone biosynthesis C-methylase UbiE
MKDAVDGREGLSPERVYRRRFLWEKERRQDLWNTLCRHWFQRDVPAEAAIVEFGAGHCEFINAIRAAKKTAVDINPDTRKHAGAGVEVVVGPVTYVPGIADASQDVVFMSNLLEHLTREQIVLTLKECRRILRAGGKVLILQPNVRYVLRDYWMFFDHITPVDDRALCEALELCGFAIERVIPRFLPYTSKSRLPQWPWLVRLYLQLPALWKLVGGQAYVVARKEG